MSPTLITRAPPESEGRLADSPTAPTEYTSLIGRYHEGPRKGAIFLEEMRVIATYALPIFGSQLLESSLVFVPVISVGHLSTKALAAISLASLTGSVTGASILQGLASALDTLLPSAYTSSQPQLMGLWAQRMIVVLFIALLPIYAIWFNAEVILLAMKQDPEVARLASLYLRWFSLGLPAFAFNAISRRYFQSQGLFFVQTRITFIVAPVNVLINYLLVWGPKQTRLGFIGAPLATAISFNFIALLSLLYGVYFAPRKAWHPISMRMFTNLGFLTRLGFFGPVALASQSILLTSSATTFQAAFSLASATSIRIGHLLALIISLITCMMYMGLRHSWARLFNDDPEVIKLVASVIPLIAFFQLMDANAAVGAAILRARGIQFTGAILNTSAYYGVGLPIGVWLAFRWNLGLHGLWTGLAVALIYCSSIATAICLKADWNHEVMKVEQRIAAEEQLRGAEEDGFA
ncbi:hypothetical protein H0H81_008702 [Sphagnurus paluster]|uniref:MATE efflux family protein n=1 Tax=Sphagnurus paluster TaxID=117069 RepID=A0A9P7FVM0_9AGAR|nr:hypothetical protein H0H81_008702 [Sphagnurus paluster]